MIKKLRIKLIAVSMISVFLVLLVILGCINLVSYRHMVNEADVILDFLSENDGKFPKIGNLFDFEPDAEGMSDELARVSRYFWVITTEDGEVTEVDVSEIAAVDPETAADYARRIMSSGKQRGFIDDYRYLVVDQGEEREGAEEAEGAENRVRIIFLDCWRSLSNFSTFLLACSWVSVLGMLAVFCLVVLLSNWIIRPVVESYEKQRQFITDAGHEIKTPITIIDADADILEMDLGENEWLQDIQKQAKRLTSLTNDLIYLSRMEENQNQVQMIDFPFSDLVEEMVQSFQALAKAQNKMFTSSIQPMISLWGDERSLRQLISVLLDNALKYSDEGGQISLALEKQGQWAKLSVFNTSSQPVDRNTSRLFNRFYRGDHSRNSKIGGYGIGLSIAAAVTANHKGRISAVTQDGYSLQITVLLPLQGERGSRKKLERAKLILSSVKLRGVFFK